MKSTNSNYYFLVFIIIGVSALAAIPSMIKAFSKTSDSFIIHQMDRVQAEMYFYKLENNNFRKACASGNINLLAFDILAELNSGLSCTTDNRYNELSLYTKLNSNNIYCVDSSGFKGYIKSYSKPVGYCSKP